MHEAGVLDWNVVANYSLWVFLLDIPILMWYEWYEHATENCRARVRFLIGWNLMNICLKILNAYKCRWKQKLVINIPSKFLLPLRVIHKWCPTFRGGRLTNMKLYIWHLYAKYSMCQRGYLYFLIDVICERHLTKKMRFSNSNIYRSD